MKQYLDLLSHIMEHGADKEDRTGTGTRSVFGYQMRFDLKDGFPLLTTKQVYLKAVIHELLWFLQGSTNIGYLQKNNVRIWNEWADKDGNVGPIYGAQWRHFGGTFYRAEGCMRGGVDQIAYLVHQLKTNPNDRRMIVSAWNPKDLSLMNLPPCHMFFQCYAVNNRLSLQMYQRSCDCFLGVPFNIASYALLLMMLAQVCSMEAGELILTMGDAHVYRNHFEQVRLQLTREPYPLPKMILNPEVKNLDDFSFGDFDLKDYQCWPKISGEVSV